MNKKISQAERDSFYKVLFSRRDVRKDFLPGPIDEKQLDRVLNAAHHAPSVGLSQPWNFIVVKNPELKRQVYEAFKQANAEAAGMFEGERKKKYSSLKLQGILDTPVNILVTCDRTRGGEVVLGKTHQPETDIYSTVCAVQNLWLSARAENIGIGWVSIIRPQALTGIFALPDHVIPIAYLCMGYVREFADSPDLETSGWEKRLATQSAIFHEKWPNHD